MAKVDETNIITKHDETTVEPCAMVTHDKTFGIKKERIVIFEMLLRCDGAYSDWAVETIEYCDSQTI